MSDPAIEAAQRAIDAAHWTWQYEREQMEAAAREALKPVREIVEDMRNLADHSAFIKRDLYAYTEALEKLVFTTEEIEELERREGK